jgi:hypothetical protein
MKVYVAARFFDKEKVKEVYKRLKADGHEITADWSKHLNPKPFSKNRQRCKKYALEDLNGTINCDVFILLTNEQAGTGSSTELGAALALSVKSNKPKIYVVGKHIDGNLFYFHPLVNLRKTINEVYKELNLKIQNQGKMI